MLIKDISLKNFRNYQECAISFDPFMNIFIGKNAQGKTNLLEAIYLLSLSKSFKTHILDEMILFNHDFAKLSTHVTTNRKDLKLDIVISKLGKKAMINSSEISKSSDYVGYLNVVLFVPEDLMLIKGSPKQRRKFIDIELSKISPIYLFNLNKYKKLLKERNQYLKLLHDKHSKEDDYLEVLTEQISKLQVDLINKRIEFVELLNDITQKMYSYISLNKEELSLHYKSTFKEINYDHIFNKYKNNYSRDIHYSNTVDGIHKDDIEIFLDNQNASTFASQGQQRSILLSIKIALLELVKKEIGEYPILLLDDVLSELDDTRKTKLLNLIQDKVQTFVTTTSIDGIHHEIVNKSKKIYIQDGKVKGE